MKNEEWNYIIARVVQNALDAFEDARKSNDSFALGRKLAYYEVLNTIKNELEIREENLDNLCLNIDLEKLL